MDIFAEFQEFQKDYPRNYARKFLINYFLHHLAKRVIKAEKDQIYQLVSAVVPEDELVSKRSLNRIVIEIYECHRIEYAKYNGTYHMNGKGGRPKKNGVVYPTVVYPMKQNPNNSST